jgi:hypothetical protein
VSLRGDANVISSKTPAATSGNNRFKALGGFPKTIPNPIPKKLAINAKFLR